MVDRLIFSSDHDEVLRLQGSAQTLVEIIGLPAELELEIATERKIREVAGFTAQRVDVATGELDPY